MTVIVLTPEQTRQVADSDDHIQFVSQEGEVLCIVDQSAVYLSDFEPLSADEERELLRRMATTEGNLITTQELLARLEQLAP